VCLTDAIDTSSPRGMLAFHALGAIAEFERALIRERSVAGLAEARRKGKTGGRPRRLTEKVAAAANAFLADGSLTSKEVAAGFGVLKATLYRCLT
jgi:DNA invertase Pin-like site-specific DNA recombinase